MLFADVVRRARRYLGGDRDAITELVDRGGGTQFDITIPVNGIVTGGLLEVDETGELLLVRDYVERERIVTVARGFQGTDQVDPLTGYVRVQPRWTHLLEDVQDQLAALTGEGLWQMATLPLTEADYDLDIDGFDLSGIAPNILGGIYGVEVRYAGDRHWAQTWRMDETVLWVPDGAVADSLTVYYPTPFGKVTSMRQAVSSVGLRDGMEDLLALGAAARALGARSVDRAQHEAYTGNRDAEDVPFEAPAVYSRQLWSRYSERLQQELHRQNMLWTPREVAGRPMRGGW